MSFILNIHSVEHFSLQQNLFTRSKLGSCPFSDSPVSTANQVFVWWPSMLCYWIHGRFRRAVWLVDWVFDADFSWHGIKQIGSASSYSLLKIINELSCEHINKKPCHVHWKALVRYRAYVMRHNHVKWVKRSHNNSLHWENKVHLVRLSQWKSNS